MPIFQLNCDAGHFWTEQTDGKILTSRCPACKGSYIKVAEIPYEEAPLDERIMDHTLLEWVGKKGRSVQIVFSLIVTSVALGLYVISWWHDWFVGVYGVLNSFGIVSLIVGIMLVWKAVRGRWLN